MIHAYIMHVTEPNFQFIDHVPSLAQLKPSKKMWGWRHHLNPQHNIIVVAMVLLLCHTISILQEAVVQSRQESGTSHSCGLCSSGHDNEYQWNESSSRNYCCRSWERIDWDLGSAIDWRWLECCNLTFDTSAGLPPWGREETSLETCERKWVSFDPCQLRIR